ncbi:MAG: 50S ribosome-binding GTPase, partial [Candidatus Uhrbacteria bacterium]|nr:50S ribosome-binding GTPase [Candidatus Uhrbacteria bacterium]
MQAPKVALIGRTNVGKSSLFNKMIEEQKSLVSDVAGTTRDRFEADCIWRGKVMRMVDTGGLDVDKSNEIERNIIEQANVAITQADLVMFMVDLTVGMTPDDSVIAKILMEAGKPVIVVGNKADNLDVRARADGPDWNNWPLMRPFAVSAKQGSGLGDLLDLAHEKLVEIKKPPASVADVLPMRIAVIGEPNVGKSTLVNALLGEKRFITASIAHTTREPNDALIEHAGRQYLFIDTAGLRRMASVKRSGTDLERKGVFRTLDILNRADVALFVIDVTKGIQGQDKHLAGILAET